MKIAIASGKGGTGKTTLSTNLTKFLAEEFPVALIDLDVEEPNSGLFVKGNLTINHDPLLAIEYSNYNPSNQKLHLNSLNFIDDYTLLLLLLSYIAEER